MPSPQHFLPFPDPAEPAIALVPAKQPALPRAPRTWYFIGTTLFALGIYAVQMLVQLVIFILMIAYGVAPTGTAAELRAVMQNGGWFALSVIVTFPFALGAIWIPVRIARQSFSNYLGLCWPSRGEVFRALVMLAAFQLAVLLSRLALGQPIPAFMTETYGSAKAGGTLLVAGGTLLVYVIGLCIAGPIVEEFVFRGFVLRGWSQSFLGPIGAVVLSSLIWAGMHTQYNLFYMFWIFTFGILLGTLRLRTGSTWLTLMLHALHNLLAIAQVALLLSRV